MPFLIAGVLFWSFTHFLPSVLPGLRARLIERFGAGPYKGLFSLDIVIALTLIIVGWRSAEVVPFYAPPLTAGPWVLVLMLISIILFVGSRMPTNIKRRIRHPQLTAVIAWSLAHLLSNGDTRSVVLFGGLGLWAILEILMINRRDGAWVRPQAVPLNRDLLTLLLGGVMFAALVYFHGDLFGPSLLGSF
ncbi:MAG TPA: NnrU family protein [Woeseiaceae bacterium]|nr:NnrU family protein [Woeseiaceae bacterium]